MDNDSPITPAELAVGHGHAERPEWPEWPMLAARWLVEGYDSDELRWLASLHHNEAHAMTVLDMRDVLHSIGISIASEDELEQRCASALAVVQRDLDSTGFHEFWMHPQVRTGGSDTVRPELVAAFVNGDYTSNAEPLHPDVGDSELLVDAANAVCDTIIDVWLTSWPECNEHFGPPLCARPEQPEEPGHAGWYCLQGDHRVAGVGELTARVATVRGAPARPRS